MNKLSICIVLLSCLVAFATAQSDSGVLAFWTDYKAKENNYDFFATNVACARIDGHKPLEWRRKYGWTAFCGKIGPQGQEACGKCLRVTNADTNEKVIVRIVDVCGVGGLVMDRDTAFNHIDSNGKGNELGHLIVDYEFVDCDQPEELKKPVKRPGGPGETDVRAYWTDYNVEKINWDLSTANVACASVNGHMPLEWRKRYGWTAFCGKVGPPGQEACGLCLRVINRNTQAEITVRIVDVCGDGPLVMDYDTAFHPIDTDGSGHIDGHLNVDYEFVECGDSQKKKIRLRSSSF